MGWIGNNFFDNIYNNVNCSYDGRDCCGCNVNVDYCTECQCLDPNGSGGGTTCPQTTTCNNKPGWIGDNYCDDINNHLDCNYDGGDCCGCNIDTIYCTECQCLDPNGSVGETT